MDVFSALHCKRARMKQKQLPLTVDSVHTSGDWFLVVGREMLSMADKKPRAHADVVSLG